MQVIHKNKFQRGTVPYKVGRSSALAGVFSSVHDVAVPQHTMFNRVAAASAVALMVLTGIATLGGNVKKQEAHATTTDARTAALALTSLPSIEVKLSNANVALAIKPTADGQFGRTSLDVDVSTNNTAGYTLTMQSNNDTLKQTLGGSEYKIESLTKDITCTTESDTECAEFPKNAWGYKVGDDGNTYSSVAPTIGSPLQIGETDVAADSSITKIYFGSKIDNTTPTGSYSGVELTFTATTKVVTYSVTYRSGNSKVNAGDVNGLPGQQSGNLNAEGNTEITLDGGSPTRANYTFMGWCSVEPTTNDATLEDSCNGGTTYQPGNVLTLDPTQSSSVYLYAMWSVTKPAIVFNFDTGISKVTVTGKFGEATNTTRDVTTTGNSLNLMAGQEYTITPDYKTGYSKADIDDIKITTGGGDLSGYNYTPNAGGATIALASKANTYRITTGTATGISSVLLNGQNCSSGCDLTFGQTYSLVATEEGGYTFSNWSVSGAGSVAGNTTKSTTFTVGAGTATITPSATLNKYTIVIKPAVSGLTVTLNGTSCTNTAGCDVPNLEHGKSYTLTAAAGSGVAFDSWSVTAGTVANSSSDSTNYTVSGAATITANGHTTKTYMQDITSATCPTTVTTVYDNRDEQEYKIQKLNDGKCWMMTNLNLGATTLSKDLTSANTNLSSTVTASTFNGWKKTSGTGTYTAGEYITVNGTDSTNGEAYGTLYNYYAASAGTITGSSNSSDASYDICPKGWKLPSGGSSGDFNTLYTTYGSNYGNMRNSLSSGGLAFTLSGGFYEGTPTLLGIYGDFWSSTRYTNTDMYDLNFETSSVGPTNSGYRLYGFSIRCVLK